jgi:7-cyano-7-deazaguanine synthase
VSVTPDRELVVLASGGVDSAILVADQSAQGQVVQPVYIRFGLAWEQIEETYLRRFLDAISDRYRVRPLATLALPIADVYGRHWSVSGRDTPDETTADEAVYLPGRNLLLLAKTTVWCALHGMGRVALGTLAGNPFADSSPAFLSGLADLAGLALGHPLEVVTPFAHLTKAEVLTRALALADGPAGDQSGLPLEHTFSCIAPVDTVHCGRCNKCAERRKAFAEAGVEDRTRYAPGSGPG